MSCSFDKTAIQAVDNLFAALASTVPGQPNWIATKVAQKRPTLSRLSQVNNLNKTIFGIKLDAGSALNEIKFYTDFAELNWTPFCKKNFPNLSESNILRLREVASANIDKRHHHIDHTNLYEIIRGTHNTDPSIDVNMVLDAENFAGTKKGDCRQRASLTTHKIIARESDEIRELNMDQQLIDSIIDANSANGGFDLGKFVKVMKSTPEDRREFIAKSMIASGSQTPPKDQNQTKEKPEESLFSLWAALLTRLKQEGSESLTPTQADLMITALETHKHFANS